MSESIREWTKRMRQMFPFEAGKVLDVGSLNVNGTVKDLFPDAENYVGIDFREGKDVDLVLDGHDIDQFQYDFDTIVCMNMLEHDDAFWITLEKMNQKLKTGGYLFIAVPTFTFPQHDYPHDYWRIGKDAMEKIIFKGYEMLNLETINTKPNVNPVVCGLGRKL